MSKYSAISRLSRYITCPGVSPEICVRPSRLKSLTSPAPSGVIGSAVVVSGRLWYSQKLIFCATPSSVTVKSLSVSPAMGAPFLSFTVTVSITNRAAIPDMVGVSLLPGCLFCPTACAPAVSAKTAVTRKTRDRIKPGNRIGQNLRRIVMDMLRIPLAPTGAPNCVLLGMYVVFQPLYTT